MLNIVSQRNNQPLPSPIKILSTCIYRPLSVNHPSSSSGSSLSSRRINHHREQEQGELDLKTHLRSNCLFTFIGKSDQTISIFLNDHGDGEEEEFVLNFQNDEGMNNRNIIPNEILILENISLKNLSKGIVHSFSMIVNSGIASCGNSVVVFQIDILAADNNSITSSESDHNSCSTNSKFKLVVSKWSELNREGTTGSNMIVGLRVLNWHKLVGKKKVVNRYLVGLTVGGELIIWEEKNLEKPLQIFKGLVDLDEMIVDFALSDNSSSCVLEEGKQEAPPHNNGGSMLGILTSNRQELKWFILDIGEKNSITIDNHGLDLIKLDCKSIITKMTSSNRSIFIYEKSNQTHIIQSSNNDLTTMDGTILWTSESQYSTLENILQSIATTTTTTMEQLNEASILKWNLTRDGQYLCLISKSNQLFISERTDSGYSLIVSINLLTNTNKQQPLPFLSKKSEFTQIIPPNLLSRFLYTNPVCILSSNHENERNLMTITWLTPTDNSAHFLCSMNKSRHSASIVLKSKRFALNIPTLPLANSVLKIGGCSGSEIDKFETFVKTDGGSGSSSSSNSTNSSDTTTTNKPLTLIERHNSNGLFHCFEECCAHLCCVIEKELEETCPGHHLFYCRIVEGHVKEGYWKEGKQFIHINNSYPPYLTFLGSQEFALTVNQSSFK